MDRDRLMLIAAFLVFTIVFFVYYPPTCAIVDESAYLCGAYAIQHGTVFYDQAGINQEHMSSQVNGHQISRYPPGNSFLMVPFALIRWHAVFIRGWLLVVIGFFLMALILRFYRLPEAYAILLLFHPTVLLYSRTVMSDLPAMVLVLAGMYAWIRKKPLWAGLIFGLSAGIRYPIIIVPLTIVALALAKKEIFPALAMTAGMIIGMLPLVIYNLNGFGTVWGGVTGYGTTFAFQNLPGTLFKFIVPLLIIYPGMLIAFFFWRSSDRWTWWLPALATVVFYSFQGYFDDTGNRWADLVMSLRYLLPVIPLILLPAIGTVSRWSWSSRALTPVVALLMIIAVLLSRRHQDFLREEQGYQDRFYAATEDAVFVLGNKEIGEMINPYRRYIPWAYFERMRKPEPLDPYRKLNSLHLACLTTEPEIREIFDRTLTVFPWRTEIVGETTPKYFSIWRITGPSN